MYICSVMNNLSMEDLYGRSNNDIIDELGKRFRSHLGWACADHADAD